ncbi:FecR family protein [Steroidobacter flavus]|uniref:FecR family protein n=1 Tax=Steroidobacter flavus TaxID=1842136 RepID=A0ABV8T350_9GAMM
MTMAISQHSGLDRVATEWVVRLTSGQASAADVEAARAWCELSDEHRAAFERARHLWQLAAPPAFRAAHTHSPVRRFATAAALALAIGLGLIVVNGHWTADYRTASGQQRSITLDDGSSVRMDSGTALDVDYSPGSRNITVRAGQASFEVMPDHDRPFVVHAGKVTATAVGTVYSVRRDQSVTDVVVSEGVVSVTTPDDGSVYVSAGEHARYDLDSEVLARERTNIDNALAWQRGVLVFELAPLEDVIAELTRHHAGYIVIASPKLRRRQVSGVFQVNRLDEGLRTLSAAFDIQLTQITPYLVVLR